MTENKNVNYAIGCGVTDCKHNCTQYCSLDKIHVGNTASCDTEACTRCDSYEHK